MSTTTLRLVPGLLKILSYLVTSCHPLSHLITRYSPSLIET